MGTTGLAPAAVTQLHALGLLAPVLLGNEIAFTEFDVRVAAVAGVLLERGVDVRLLGSLRRVAEREVGLIDDLSAPLRRRAVASPANRPAASRWNWLPRSPRCARCCTNARCRTTSVARRKFRPVSV